MRFCKFILYFLIVITGTGLLVTCDTPIGLGEKINTEYPVIKIPDDPGGISAPGSFLFGSDNIIYLDVQQDFGITQVYMVLQYNKPDGTQVTVKDEGKDGDVKIFAQYDKSIDKWFVNIDTIALQMCDGKVIAWVTAIDVSGKSSTSTDIIYIVKNKPPQIQMNIPLIQGADFDDLDLNDVSLNNDPVFVGFDIMGLATDEMGIRKGFPKIMIWPVYNDPGNPQSGKTPVDADGVPLDPKWGTWRSTKVPNAADGLTATKFSWPMFDLVHDPAGEGGYSLAETRPPSYLPTGYYNIRIWVQDLNGRNNFYPNRVDNKAGPGGTPVDPKEHPNQYMRINYMQNEIPVVKILTELDGDYTAPPYYYNGSKDFTAVVNVICKNPIQSVIAYVTKDPKEPKDPGYNSAGNGNEFYMLKQNPDYLNEWILTVTAAEAQAWKTAGDGSFYMNFIATDNSQKSNSAEKWFFILDTTAPTVAFDRPAVISAPTASGTIPDNGGSVYSIYYPDIPPIWIINHSTIGGTALDDYGIKEIWYHIGKLGDDGKSTEECARIYAAAPWKNSGLGTSFIEPGWGGSLYTWNYSFNFNDFRKDPKTMALIQESSELEFDRRFTDPLFTTAKQYHEQEDENRRFYLPFYVKVVDSAENYHIVHYKVCVDPELDIPQVNIIYPDEGALLGGQVTVQGMAYDNDWIHSVDLRVWNTNLQCYYLAPGTAWINQRANHNDRNDPDAGWFKVRKRQEGVAIPWYVDINGDTLLTPTDIIADENIVIIEARAWDTKDANRIIPDVTNINLVSRTVRFSSRIPVISVPQIKKDGVADRQYKEGIKASGKFKISMNVTDSYGINSLKFTFNINGITRPEVKLVEDSYDIPFIDTLYSGRVTLSPQIFSNGKYERKLDIECDTINHAALFPGLGYGNTGNIMLTVEVENLNETKLKTTERYSIGVDNFYPSLDIETHFSARGTAFEVGGIARDYPVSGEVHGLARVLVYFEEAYIDYANKGKITGTGKYLNQRGKTIGENDSFYSSYNSEYGLDWENIPSMITYPFVKDTTKGLNEEVTGGTNGPNVFSKTNFPLLKQIYKGYDTGYVWESPHAMVIDNAEIGKDTDIDLDGTYGEMWSGLVDKTWQAKLNTKDYFEDRPYIVHYVIMDEAENAAYYRREMFVENNKPLISSVQLGTDITGTGTVTDSEYSLTRIVGTTAAGSQLFFAEPSFRVRNSLFSFKIATEKDTGNNGKFYRISYVEADGTTGATNMKRGSIYTIVTSGSTDWQLYGAVSNSIGTTFVASGPGIGTGTVKKYKEIRTVTNTMETDSVIVNLHDIFFADEVAVHVPDSKKYSSTDIIPAGKRIGDIKVHNDRLFIVKVFDETILGGREEDQLAHAVLVAVDIDNEDVQSPEVVIKPFFWNSAVDNSLYNNSKVYGHIEFSEDLPASFNSESGIADRDPKASGIVSFRGTVKDNILIHKIFFSIDKHSGGYYTGMPVETYLNHGLAALYTDGAWSTEESSFAKYGWQFVIEKEILDQAGHYIEWRIDYDTAKISGIASPDNTLTVTARDTRTASGGANTADEKEYRFDVVPYITSIETNDRTEGGLKNTNIRSADGKYSIKQGSISDFITVKGFNLNPKAVRILTTGQKEDHAANPAGAAYIGANLTSANIVVADSNSFTMTNNVGYSGYLLVLNDDTLFTLNNINNNNALGSYKLKLSKSDSLGLVYIQKENVSNGSDEENMPNREADRYVTKNITLTDDRYLQFFTVKKTNVRNGYNPVMMMEGDNPVFGYVDLSGGTMGNARIGPNTSAGNFNPSYAQPQRTRFNLASGNREDTEYLILANIWDGMGMTRDESGRYLHATTYNRDAGHFHLIYDRYAELHSYNGNYGTAWGAGVGISGYTGNWAYDRDNNAIVLERVDVAPGLMLDRFVYPKLIAKGNSITSYANYYMSYFDNASEQIIFRNFRIGLNGQLGGTNNRLFNLSTPKDAGGYEYNAFTNLPTTNTSTSSVLNRNVAANNASTYFDIAVDSTGRAILAYYNERTGKLIIQYTDALDGSNPNNTGITWTTSKANAAMPSYTGMYVSMTIDNNDKLHIAAFDALDSTLKYIFVDNFKAASTGAAGVVKVTIDQYGSVGHWTDIKIKDGVPYIAYYNVAETGGREAIKMAYAKNQVTSIAAVKGGVDSNGYTTGNWEYRTIPAIDPPQGGSLKFQKVNLDFTTNGRPVLGYLGANIEFSYPVNEQP